MGSSPYVIALSLCSLFMVAITGGLCYSGCIRIEREALLNLKLHLADPSNRLRNWVSDDGDCCRWSGVTCDNSTGHVLKLNLSTLYNQETHLGPVLLPLGGKISPSLLDLKHFRYLDLSNNFGGIEVPTFLGFLVNLRYLSLSNAGFGGMIPQQLGNLSNLQYLSLQGGYIVMHVDDLQWLSNLSSLTFLDMSSNDLSKSFDWLQGPIPSGLQNLSLLVRKLDLSYNNYSSSIPTWLCRLSNLELLNLGSNSFQGQISSLIGNITSLRNLDLSYNRFEGGIPRSLKHLCNLRLLSFRDCWMNWPYLVAVKLNNNRFHGNIPKSIGTLSLLESLHIRNNNLFGEVPISLRDCTGLITLDLSENKLAGNIPTWIGENYSSLNILSLRANEFYGHIPEELCRVASLHILDLVGNNLSGTIPSCFNSFTTMVKVNDSIGQVYLRSNYSGSFLENAFLVIKGKMVKYNTTLRFDYCP
ncbi:serine-threonine protein kinase, plant-type, putative [Ricinus communis]|uniref:Serine-threonine protein kinase, plant-type, putative n=1 Tax=Ricinus communis TaxID=3988 RepID=B9SGD8_RICCO|nr:serine-threonine protein kinase, plant-type, putative [Ricinus communis]